MHKKFLTLSGLGLAVVLFFVVNVLSNAAFTSTRLDLTEHQLYTLSEGSLKILQGLDEPITLRFYVSKKLAPLLPGIHGYVVRVRELLDEFEQAAAGNVVVQVLDPEPFSEEEDRAVAYGLKGVPVSESDSLFYFGLVGTSSTDEEAVIPFIQPERQQFLEYDLAKLVYQLAHPKQKVIGLISSLPLDGTSSSPFPPGAGSSLPWVIHDQIQQSFTVRTLSGEVMEVPEDVDVLMVVHPKNLAQTTLYAIDQFVLAGGRALVFVDPHSEADQGPLTPRAMTRQRHSDLKPLFAAWGIELVGGKVLGDLPFARRVQYRKEARILAANYPVWIDLPSSQFNKEQIVTAQLPNLTVATPGILRKTEKSETEFIPLVQSSEDAMQIPASQVQFVTDIGSLLQNYTPAGERFTLAARVTGNVKSAFPDGPPAGEAGSGERRRRAPSGGPHLTESSDPINVIVVADTDLLQDYFWVQLQSFLGQRIGIPTAGNGAFVVNALDNLTGSNDLINVRTRSGFTRPFTFVRAIQQEAEQRFRQTEQELLQRKRATERKIQELQAQKQDSSALILSAEQEQEIERFRQELIFVRKELRSVQHELHKNIETLESWLKFMNIGLMPLLIGVFGLVISLRHAHHSRHPNRTGHTP